jgi:nucleotide-binding universal stress UspA family protein
MAKGQRGTLVIAHVIPPVALMPGSYAVASVYDHLFRAQRQSAQRQLDRLVAKTRAAGVRTSGVMLDTGVAAEGIVRLARRRRADTIVLGTHGRTGLTRALVGSVAAQVLTAAHCPVVTVRADVTRRPSGRVRRVVHATDFSPASRPAFRTAVALAKSARAELVIAHVLAPVIAPLEDAYLPPQTWDRLIAGMRSDAERHLARLVARARAEGVRATGRAIEGPTAEAIARAARQARADYLVVGTHGRTGLPRVLLGSVAARVVASAPCPVLTVRAALRRARRPRAAS